MTTKAKISTARNFVQERSGTLSLNSPRRLVWGGAVLIVGALMVIFACLAVSAGAVFFWTKFTGAPTTGKSPAPTSAVLQEMRGLVEVQVDGWHPARLGQLIPAGVSFRTGVLSAATLVLADGSLIRLGPATEMVFETLNASADGPRVVRLNQLTGESDHTVTPSANTASVYEVLTPAGSGAAKGTVFHVQTTADGRSRFDVQEGAVVVSNQAVTVTVLAGQATQVLLNKPPVEPSFRVTGEGTVSQKGTEWVVAGRTFATDDATVVVGDPQIGDWVSVQGHLLASGTALAERIEQVHRTSKSRFVFMGAVESMGAAQWTIAGRQVNIESQTQMAPGLTLGALVRVEGRLGDNGELWAESIQPVVSGFQFTGVVQSIASDQWRIADITVSVGVSTTLSPGLKVGDSVQVNGEILANGRWLAKTIQPAKVTLFDFMGIVVRQNPWNVSGVELMTNAATDIDTDIQVGNRVHVSGQVLPDGTWLAASIAQVDEGQRHAIQFTARVQSISPWVVGGVTVTVDAKTRITSGIQVGDLVVVKGNLLPDGTVVANTITPVTEMTGCVESAGIITTVQGSQLTLMDGLTLTVTSSVKVSGDLHPGSVILIRSCLNAKAESMVVRITVLYQLGTLPTPGPSLTPTITLTSTLPAPQGDKVTICHNFSKNNPHTITIDRSALPAHLAHGDRIGQCP